MASTITHPSSPLRALPAQVAIIGRPNVGKSALFNRLVRRREALVANTPGGHVTRDYQEGAASLGDLRFRAVDTSGLEPFQPGDSIQARATELTTRVLGRADAALLLLDGQTGLLPADEQLARWLRRAAPALRVLPVANKCERRGPAGETAVAEAVAEAPRLGFGEAVAVSAETGEGMAELYEALQPLVDALVEARRSAVAELAGAGGEAAAAGTAGAAGRQGQPAAGALECGGDGAGEASSSGGVDDAGPLKIAIMGLPNVVSPPTEPQPPTACLGAMGVGRLQHGHQGPPPPHLHRASPR